MPTIFAGDEAGNLGFERGGTRFFVIALVKFQEPEQARAEIDEFKAKRSLRGREFSFHEVSSTELKTRIFELLGKMNLIAWVLIVDKTDFPMPVPSDGIKLYASIFGEAIARIPLKERNKCNLILDEYDRSGRLLREIAKVLKDNGLERGFKKISAKRSFSEPLIQVADLIAGAVYRSLAVNDDTLLRVIQHKVIVSELEG